MLSIITTGRNDDYGGGFLDRFYTSVIHNTSHFYDYGITFEYIISEWMPYREYLAKNLSLSFYNIRTVVVDKSLAEPEQLNRAVFFEYFAKNAAIRRAKYDNILLINSDIVLPCRIIDEIVDMLRTGLDDDKFYRTRYRQQSDINSYLKVKQTTDLHNPAWDDSCICGAYSGDFLLIKKKPLIEVGQGYNETDPDHRITYQTNMDGEILWNMYNAGMRLEFINEPYIHIDHGKNRQYDNGYKIRQSYTNKPDWGFVNYPSRLEDDGKTEVIYHES